MSQEETASSGLYTIATMTYTGDTIECSGCAMGNTAHMGQKTATYGDYRGTEEARSYEVDHLRCFAREHVHIHGCSQMTQIVFYQPSEAKERLRYGHWKTKEIGQS
tara:strand:+ start:1062 stop:1379 length:318 start_codon:yes stop_codon:yes gene_type:complete